MTSPTGQVRRVRAAKKATQGRKRKALAKNHGSTRASLPLDKPNANELAQKKKAHA